MLAVASFSDQPRLVIAATTCGFQTDSAEANGTGAPARAVRYELSGEFQHDPAGDLRSDAGDLREGLAVAGVRGDPDGFRFVDGQHGQGEAGTDAADAEQDIEHFPLVIAGEAEQGQRVLPHDQGREQLALVPDPEAAEGLRRGVDAHAGAVEVDHGGGQANVRYGSAKKTDQGRAPGSTAKYSRVIQKGNPAIRTYLRIA